MEHGMERRMNDKNDRNGRNDLYPWVDDVPSEPDDELDDPRPRYGDANEPPPPENGPRYVRQADGRVLYTPEGSGVHLYPQPERSGIHPYMPPEGPTLNVLNKKTMRRSLMVVSLSLAGFLIVMQLVAGIVAMVYVSTSGVITDLVAKMLESGGQMSMTDVMNDPDYLQASLDATSKSIGIASLLGIVCGLPMMLIARGKKLFTTDITTVAEPVKGLDILMLIVLLMGIQCVTTIVTMALDPLLAKAGLSLTDYMNNAMESLMSPTGVLYIVLVGPIVEELVFRGAILRKLEVFGGNFAIVISSLLFAAYHMILIQGFFAFFVGILLAYTTKRFSIKWAILLHILNNGFSVTMSLLKVPDMIILAFFGLCLVGSIVLLAKNGRKLSIQRETGAPALEHPFRIAFTSPFLIILLAVLIAIGFLMLKIM
jgi:membrane protease YdiL (CAAX protease family)